MTAFLTRRAALGLGAGLLAAPRLARAQAAKLRFTLDWTFHGAYAFVAAAERNGIFRDAGLDVSVSRGYGSGRVPVDLAAGTYDMGIADLTPALRFMAENPDRGLVCVAMVYDRSPLCATVRADGPITTPKMLEGKTLAAPEFDGGRQIFPVFAKAVGLDLGKINWMSVTPELREPMLVQKRADGITGFVTSTGLSLKALGMDWPAQRIFYYRDYGLDFYGSGLLTTKEWLAKNPDTARVAVGALMKAALWSYRNPEPSIAFLKQRETLTDVAIESERQAVAIREMFLSDKVKANGISYVEPARLQAQIDATVAAFNLPNKPNAGDVYTTTYLPAAADLKL